MLSAPAAGMVPPVEPWLGMLLVTVACGALLAGVTPWKRRSGPPAELTRKAVHVGMGTIALSLPWLFTARWPVIVLCGGLGAAFLGLKRFARRSDLGSAMHDVNRQSLGDLYFAMSVAALWVLARGDRLLFVVPVLVLTLGDAVAALVGRRYGKLRFDGRPGGKSLEGSVALFVVTFLSVQLPITLSQRVAPPESVLMAASMAAVVTLLEAVAWRGLDNVFVPLGAFLLLETWIVLDAGPLLWRFLLVVGLLAIVAVAGSRTTLRDVALAGAALFGYVAGTLGGPQWLVPPVLLFVTSAPVLRAAPAPAGREAREHDLLTVTGIAMPALAWLFAARVFDVPAFYAPYAASFVAQMAMVAVVRASVTGPGGGQKRLLRVVSGGAAMVLPALSLHRPWSAAVAAAVLAFSGAVMAGLAVNGSTAEVTSGLGDETQWLRQARWALGASALASIPWWLGFGRLLMVMVPGTGAWHRVIVGQFADLPESAIPRRADSAILGAPAGAGPAS